jgi:hypothetical protein
MLRFSVFALPLRLRAAILSMPVAALVFTSTATAALLDFNVASSDFNTSRNWINYTTADTTAVPTTADEAIVRNGGTLNITTANGDANALVIRVGAGPQSGDPVGPPTYGGTGTLNITGGNIIGGANGVRLNVGERDNTNNINYPGTVNQSGGKVSLNVNPSFLVVGASGNTSTPVSSYNLSGTGTIALTIGSGNTNNGINVRNGTFNMTGGSIVDDPASSGFGQRAMTISSSSGPDAANPNVAIANISAGTWDTRGGIRLASNARSSGYLNISGTADIKVRSDVNLTNNASDAYAEINMTGGSFKVGETGVNDANLIIGDRAVGVMNLSGGTVAVSDTLKIANDAAGSGGGAGKGTVTMTGGTMTTRSLDMRVKVPTSAADWDAGTATFIIDGPTASFTQANTASAGSTKIGNTGVSLFEVRQGVASLGGGGGNIELAATATAAATVNLKGGRLILSGNVTRTNTTPGVFPGPLSGKGAAPVVGLTGGVLELNAAGASQNWQTDLTLAGSELLTKLNTQLVVNVGDATHPGNFTMNSGSWDIDILGHSINNADRIVVGGTGTAALNGGTLNLNYISGYSPVIGDSLRIVGLTTGAPTVNSGAISILAPASPFGVWTTAVVGSDIRLQFVPEPASCMLAVVGLMFGMGGYRHRS